MDDLTFKRLSEANAVRALERNRDGVMVWTPTQWALGMFGECGEACNIIKKLNRIEVGDPGTKRHEGTELYEQLVNELADVVIYADLLSQRLNLDLALAIKLKFNNTSVRLGLKTMIE